MNHLTDLEFLERHFKPKHLEGLSDDKPIFSIAVDHTLLGRGGFGHRFTHDPSKTIRSFWAQTAGQSGKKE